MNKAKKKQITIPAAIKSMKGDGFFHHLLNPSVDLKFFNDALRNAITCGLAVGAGWYIVMNNVDPSATSFAVITLVLVACLLALNLVQLILAFSILFKLEDRPSKLSKFLWFLPSIGLGVLAYVGAMTIFAVMLNFNLTSFDEKFSKNKPSAQVSK